MPGSVDSEAPPVGVCVEVEVEEVVVEEDDDDEEDEEEEEEDVVLDEVDDDFVFVEDVDDDLVVLEVVDVLEVVAVNVPVKVTRSLLMASVDMPEAVAATLWPSVLADPQPYW